MELVASYFEPIESWFRESAPRSWLSHSLIWLLLQSGGLLLERILPRVRRPVGQTGGFGLGLVFYGQRELRDGMLFLSREAWGMVGDSALDFLLPLAVNAAVLLRLCPCLPGPLEAAESWTASRLAERLWHELRSGRCAQEESAEEVGRSQRAA